jgi:hypothetical protein
VSTSRRRDRAHATRKPGGGTRKRGFVVMDELGDMDLRGEEWRACAWCGGPGGAVGHRGYVTV